MYTTLYSYRGVDIDELNSTYSAIVEREFYGGKLKTRPRGSRVSNDLLVEVHQALARPISLLRIRTNVLVNFRRNSLDIKKNNEGLRVIWFVKRGLFNIVTSSNTKVIGSDQFGIIDSSVPFVVDVSPDEDGLFESFQAIIPSSIFLSHPRGYDNFNGVFSVDSNNKKFLTKLLSLLFDEEVDFSPRTASSIVAGFLEEAFGCAANEADTRGHFKTISERRFYEINEYIEGNTNRHDLSYEMVAEEFSISSRYLGYLLKQNGTTFSEFLIGKRLKLSREFLTDQSFDILSIQEIAFRAGFKSSAHFSRIFKKHFGITPSHYRNTVRVERSDLRHFDRGQ